MAVTQTSIKNYTSNIAVSKTVGEITAILAKRGAQRVATTFDDEGISNGVTFTLETDYGVREFSLPARIDGVFDALKNDPKIAKAQRTRDKAARVAWRITKDWLEIQFALIDAEMARLDEVLLPFMVDGTGKTIYSVFRATQMKEIEQ